jgi:hypothetical protein
MTSYPLPEDPTLAEAARAIRDTGHWGWIVDRDWRVAWSSDEVRLSFGALVELAPFELGNHLFGPEWMRTSEGWRMGSNSVEINRVFFRGVGGLMLADTPGGREELRRIVDPSLSDVVDELAPADGTMLSFTTQGFGITGAGDVPVIAFRLRGADGRLAGTAMISKPAAGMAMLAALTFTADLGHIARMGQVAKAGRRPAAILFADLEASSPLARRLSTASYFALGRRLVRAADQCVVDAGGLVGRHVGDGVGAFFLAETAGSESAAAYSCIAAARALRGAVADVAERTGLKPEEVVLRFGLTGARTSTSATSARPAAPRSTRSATRSTRPRASRPAPAAGSHSPRRTSSSASSRTPRPPSASTRIASPTPASATSRPRPRRPGGTLRPSPSARSEQIDGGARSVTRTGSLPRG